MLRPRGHPPAAGRWHCACLSGLGPTTGWEVVPTLLRGLPFLGSGAAKWLFRQEAPGTKAVLRPEMPWARQAGWPGCLAVALIWPAAGRSPSPRGQGCPAQGLQTPRGVGGTSLWVRPYTGHRNAVSCTARFYRLDTKTHSPGSTSRCLEGWTVENLSPAVTKPAVRPPPAHPTAAAFVYVRSLRAAGRGGESRRPARSLQRHHQVTGALPDRTQPRMTVRMRFVCFYCLYSRISGSRNVCTKSNSNKSSE